MCNSRVIKDNVICWDNVLVYLGCMSWLGRMIDYRLIGSLLGLIASTTLCLTTMLLPRYSNIMYPSRSGEPSVSVFIIRGSDELHPDRA